jgi:hypothetical protein
LIIYNAKTKPVTRKQNITRKIARIIPKPKNIYLLIILNETEHCCGNSMAEVKLLLVEPADFLPHRAVLIVQLKQRASIQVI